MTNENLTQLARRAHAGDLAAFEALVAQLQRPVYGLCWRYLRSSEADDAAQEAFVQAFVHRSDIDPARPILPWVMTIARRLCLDRLRRRAVEERATEHMTPSEIAHPSPFEQVATRLTLARMEEALATLSEGPREAVVLFHVDHLTYAEIADVLSAPLGTVMTWIHRGRQALRAAVEAEAATKATGTET